MFFIALLSIFVLNIIYVAAFFAISIWLEVTESHYFLGYYPRLFRFRIRHVTFHVGFYIPLVGLARIYTITDDGQRMKYPWEFFQYPLWRRLVATLGGAIGLLVSGVFVNILLTYFETDHFISKETLNKYGIYPSEDARRLGFKSGDRIIAINGKDFSDFDEVINPELLLAPDTRYTVQRDGNEIEIRITGLTSPLSDYQNAFLTILNPYEVGEVAENSPAERSGIVAGDRIVEVNGQPVVHVSEMMPALRSDDDGEVSLLIERNQDQAVRKITVSVKLDDERKLGVRPRMVYQYSERGRTIWRAATEGSAGLFRSLYRQISGTAAMISGRTMPARSLGGPIAMSDSDRSIFWHVTSIYAVFYAIYNLLPLPLSAFWEMVPLVYEWVRGKRFAYHAFRRSLKIGWVIVGVVMVWVLVNDLAKIFA